MRHQSTVSGKTSRWLMRSASHWSFLLGLSLVTVPALCAGKPSSSASADLVQLSTASQLMHLTVGHSLFLNTATRLRRVYVSNPAVLASFTASPTQVLVTAKTAGVSTLVVWDDAGRSSVYTVSADVDVDGLRAALNSAFPQAAINVTPLQDRISLSGTVGTQDEFDGAAKLAGSYSKDVANSIRILPPHVKQVQLRVRIAEIDRTKAEQLGFNFISGGKTSAVTGTQQFPAFGGFTLGGSAASTSISVTNPLNLLLYSSEYNIGAAIQDLAQKQVMQILAEPTITSVSGKPASFLSGGEFPFPVVQGGTGSFVSVTVQFRPYGVKLEFTPFVNPDGTIRLKVAPEVSALDYTNEVEISGYDIPAIDTRRAETEVELKNGQSFAISGLLDHRLTDAFSKMPGIASVPILGQLFRSKSVNVSTTELVVIVTPTIVDPLDAATPPAALPTFSKPFLNNKQFDEQLRKKKSQPQNPASPQPAQPSH